MKDISFSYAEAAENAVGYLSGNGASVKLAEFAQRQFKIKTGNILCKAGCKRTFRRSYVFAGCGESGVLTRVRNDGRRIVIDRFRNKKRRYPAVKHIKALPGDGGNTNRLPPLRKLRSIFRVRKVGFVEYRNDLRTGMRQKRYHFSVPVIRRR